MKSMNRLFAFACLLTAALSVNAQFLRTSYFMDGSHYRQQLNPALTPRRGYLNLPVVGSFNATLTSSSLGYQDVCDIIEYSDESNYFTSDDFFGRLENENNINANIGFDIISAGWYRGKNFWSFNVGLRTDIGTTIPRSMFSFMRQMDGMDLDNIDWSNFHTDMSGVKLNMQAYAEVGLGYARNITDKLTVGGRVKALLGAGNIKMEINKVNVQTNLTGVDANLNWSEIYDNPEKAQELADRIGGTGAVEVDAKVEASVKGLELIENEDGYIDDVDFKDPGLAGWGLGIDLGASYKVLDRLTVSASVLDLGFLKWDKKNTKLATARSSEDLKFDFNKATIDEKAAEVERFANTVGSGELLNYDLMKLEVDNEAKESRTTRLTTTLVVGAEYELLKKWLTVGALYTGRFAQPKTVNEITLSANCRPNTMINLAASYSLLQGAGKTIGLAAKFGPLFIGTDYMFFGKDTKNINAYLGISIPLGKQKKN